MITVRVPGDKSISHRALMLAPLASGASRVDGLATGADVVATGAAMVALGVPYELAELREGRFEVRGPVDLRSPHRHLDCGNSGTTARILLGLLAGRPVTARLDGDASLRRRPMARVIEPLRRAGARIVELGEPGRLPLEVQGGALAPLEHETAVASAQVKSAILLAGLGAGVPACVIEPGPSRDHTERMLGAMGVRVEVEELSGGWRVCLAPPDSPLRALDLAVPGDFSSAAYFLALGLLSGAGAAVRLEGVGLNPRRTGLLRVLEAMGADLEVELTDEVAGEPVGAVVARGSELRGVDVPPEWMPTLLDEVPILAVTAVRASGRTTIRGAGELRVKESDRLATLAANLIGLGVEVHEDPDGLTIDGTAAPLRGPITTEGDHRIAMAFGVLDALPGNELEIDDVECVQVSFPGFWTQLEGVRAAP